MELAELVDRLTGVRHLPSGIAARCPAHDDQVQSLMVNAGRAGGVVVHCHAGCLPEAVMGALGLSLGDLVGAPRHVATYNYTTASGELLYAIERWANPKTFRTVPAGVPPAQRVLYQLPAIAWARDLGQTLYVLEGEKDCDRLAELGIPATTCPHGAGGWLPHYNAMLAGCHLVIVADNDKAGRAHARQVAREAGPDAASYALCVPAVGNDVSDLLDAGYQLDALLPMPEEEPVGVYLASTVPTRRVKWVWPGYIAAGKITIIEGDPGDGKSLITCDVAARLTSGTEMPDKSAGAGPWPVIMISAEDDLDDTIVPRLAAAGARLDRLFLVTHGATPELPFDLATDLPSVYQLAARTKAGAIVLDPISAFLPDKTDSHNDHSVRRALYPLKLLASVTGCAVVVVRHLNKGNGKAIYRGGGSIGFGAASRAIFAVAPAPDDETARIMACVKNNLAVRPPALRYRIDTHDGMPYVQWLGQVDMSAQAILDGRPDDHEAREEKQAARRVRVEEGQFLCDMVKDAPLSWAEIVRIGKEAGYSEITLRRARGDVGLAKIYGPGGTRDVVWTLPDITTERVPQPPTCSDAHQNESRPGTSLAEQEIKRSPESDAALSNEDRDAALEARPSVCDVCNSPEANRWFKPWWVIRCTAHNPLTYRGGGS